MRNARTRRPSSPPSRPAVGEMLESRRLLAGHGPMWNGPMWNGPMWNGGSAHGESAAGDSMPLRQNRPALAAWGLGRANMLLVIALQNADAGAMTNNSLTNNSSANNSSAGNSSAGSSSVGTSSLGASTSGSAAAGVATQAAGNSAPVTGTRFNTVLAAATAARSTGTADAVRGVAIGDAVPASPAARTAGSTPMDSDAAGAKGITVPVKIVTAAPTAVTAVTAGPTLAYETVRRPLFAREQIPVQSRRAIEATEAQADEQPAAVIAEAKVDQAVATASIAPISIDPLSQPLWQRVAAMAAAGMLVLANTVARRRARRSAMTGVRR